MNGYITGVVIGSIIILSAFALYIVLLFKNHSIKKLIKKIGQTAEDRVNADIKIWAKHTNNRFIPASLFKYNENQVFEVDSIIVTSSAIVVVEIKSINGGIKGKSSDPKWTKNLDETSHYITNPIIQNDKHIDHIVKMTSMKVPMISLIVYSNRAKYLDITEVPPHVAVIRHAELFDKLDEIERSLPPRLSPMDAKNMFKAIKSYRSTDAADLSLHKKITTGVK